MTCPSCGRESPAGFRFCGFCGAPLTAVSPGPREERKVVTVLFCDLVGFTARSDRADPEDVKATLRPFHSQLKREIEAFGGTLDKFIGDAALGVFGSPVAHEDDPERAVRAGLAIVASMAELDRADPELRLAVRLGIETGEAVVAHVPGGGPQIGEAVTGDVVNTASRLQSVAPVGGIVVGEATYRATRDVVAYERLEPVTVKGKAEPLAIWRAVEARGRFGADLTRTHASPFVGRANELGVLRDAFDRTRGGSVHLVTVLGEPGVGKSRLVAELARHVGSLPGGVTWRRGRCLPYGEGITFWALGEIVKAQAGILESDPPEEALAKLDAAVPRHERDREWLRRRLAPLVGIEAPSNAEREEAFTAWARFLEVMAGARPAVFVFEDVHWADPALLGFIQHVAATSRETPMLLLCTARPEVHDRAPRWGEASNATTIDLSPLTRAETAWLISGLLDRAVLPPEVQALLLERAGGNPLYAGEFVRMLQDQGLLIRDGETWRLAEGAEVRFPDSVQSLIAARLDTLAPSRKAVLQDASVVGKVFWSGAVAAIGAGAGTGGGDTNETAGDGAIVDGAAGDGAAGEALGELSRRELIHPVATSSIEGQAEFAFSHVLVRDVCYRQIPRAARAAKHRAAAAWIERVAAERVEDQAEVLAHHHTTALRLARASGQGPGVPEIEADAIRFLVLAGDRALGLDVGRAEAHYARALELAGPEHGGRPEIVAKWADAVRQGGRAAEAAGGLEEAVEAFRARGERMAAARAMGTLSSLLLTMGHARQEEVAAEAVRLLESEPPGPELVAAYARMAGAQLVLGALRPAIAWADRAAELASELGVDVPARALGFRGFARCSLGDAEGLADMRTALALAVERGEGRDAAVLQNNLAVALLPIEGPASVLAVCEEGVSFAERRGIDELALAIAAASLDPLIDAGQWDRALDLAESAARRAEAGGSVADLLQARWAQVRVLAWRGEGEAAEPLASWLAGAVREAGGAEDLLAGLSAAALVHALLGRRTLALELLSEVEATPHVRDAPTYPAHLCGMVRTAVEAGDVALASRLRDGVEPVFPYHRHALCAAAASLREAAGELQDAAAGHAEAAGRWERFGVVPERGHALLGQGRCLLGLGRPAEAARPLRAAREVFAALRAGPAMAEADALLGRALAPMP